MTDWLITKALIHYLRRFNKRQSLGLRIDAMLDAQLGQKRSEKVQKEIIGILRKIIRDLENV